MSDKKPPSKLKACFTFICGVITALSWLGITPDRVGQVAYDVLFPVLPFASMAFGALTGWFAHDWLKWHEAETAARIERENAEHAEKMRLEREKRERQVAEEARRSRCVARFAECTKRNAETAMLCKAIFDRGGRVTVPLLQYYDYLSSIPSQNMSLAINSEAIGSRELGGKCHELYVEDWAVTAIEDAPELLDGLDPNLTDSICKAIDEANEKAKGFR